MSKNFTVALIGPDGAGKSTIGHKLEEICPLRLKYLYMGVNLESSNMVLPTTRILLELKRSQGQRPDIATRPREAYLAERRNNRKPIPRLLRALKAFLRFVNLAAEEWYRQMIVWYYSLRGYHVIFDRHFYFDYYAHDVVNDDPNRPIYSHIHGFMLKKLYPKPDFVVFLDAPSEVLFSRKPEGSIEALERRRAEYLQLREALDSWAVVDVSQPVDDVAQEVSDLIMRYHRNKNGVEKVKQWSD